MFSIKELAERFCVDEQAVRKLIRDNKLEAHKIGGSWRITEEQVQALLERSKNTNG